MSFLRKVYGDRDQNQKISLVIMKDKMLYQLIGAQSSKTVDNNCYKDKIWMPFLSKVYGDREQNQKISLVIMKDKMFCQLTSAQSSKNYVQRLYYL